MYTTHQKKTIALISIVFLLVITGIPSSSTLIEYETTTSSEKIPKKTNQISPEWQHTYGGENSDFCTALEQTSNDGYVLLGTTFSFGAGNTDIWLIKTDTAGKQLWTKTFGTPGRDSAGSLKQTTDNGYIIAATTQPNDTTPSDILLIRTDSEGNELWNKTHGGNQTDTALAIEITPDEGYIIAGYTRSYGKGNNDVFLLKTDAAGKEQWNVTYGGELSDVGYHICQTDDGGFIIGAYTASYATGLYDAWAIKTDEQGNEQWNKSYGGAEFELGWRDIIQTADNGFLMTGSTRSEGAGNDDTWLVKTDSNGDLLWSKTFGGLKNDYGSAIYELTDGYILVGSFGASMSSPGDAWVIKVDSEGNTIWVKGFGGYESEGFNNIIPLNDQEFIIAGSTASYGSGQFDFWLTKINSPTEKRMILIGGITDIELAHDHLFFNAKHIISFQFFPIRFSYLKSGITLTISDDSKGVFDPEFIFGLFTVMV